MTCLLWEDVVGSRKDMSHKGTVFDVFIVADNVHGVVAWFCRPIGHIAGAVALVVTLDLGLGWSLNGKAYRERELGALGSTSSSDSNTNVKIVVFLKQKESNMK